MHALGLSVPNQVNNKNERWLTFLLIPSSPGATSLFDHRVIVSNRILVQPIKTFWEAQNYSSQAHVLL